MTNNARAHPPATVDNFCNQLLLRKCLRALHKITFLIVSDTLNWLTRRNLINGVSWPLCFKVFTAQCSTVYTETFHIQKRLIITKRSERSGLQFHNRSCDVHICVNNFRRQMIVASFLQFGDGFLQLRLGSSLLLRS